MKMTKCLFTVFLLLFFAAQTVCAQGKVVAAAGKVIGKEMIAPTASGAVWKGFSKEIVPVVKPGVVPAGTKPVVKLPTNPTIPLRGGKIVSQLGNLPRNTVVNVLRPLNPEVPLTQIKRTVVQEMPRFPKEVPHITEGHLSVQSFEGIDLSGYVGPSPIYPLPTSNVNVYRGMHLTVQDLKAILRKGLRLEDNPHNAMKEANGASKSQYLASFGTAPIPSSVIASTDLSNTTYTTISTSEALHYAMEGVEEGEVPVILKLGRKYRNRKNKVNDHYLVKEDISPEDIEEVLVLVRDAEGNPLWCKAQLAEGGELRLYPYTLP